MKKLNILLFAILMNPLHSLAETANQPYEQIQLNNVQNGRLYIYYFFNINCNSCKKFEEEFTPWSTKNNIEIIYAPYSPYEGWEWASKTFLLLNDHSDFGTPWSLREALENTDILPITNVLKAVDSIVHVTGMTRAEASKVLMSFETEKQNNKIQYYGKKLGVTGTPNLVVFGERLGYRISPEYGLTAKGMVNILDAVVSYERSIKLKR